MKSIVRLFLVGFVIIALLGSLGCAKKAEPLSAEDNPQHHYLRGMVLLEKPDVSEVERRFARALELEPNFPPALAGMGLVRADQAAVEEDIEVRDRLVEEADDFLDKGLRKSKTDSERFIAYVGRIRAETHMLNKGFLDEAEDAFKYIGLLKEVDPSELSYYGGKEAAGYFMGRAYLAAYEFRRAEDVLSGVLGVRTGKWHAKADHLYKKIQKILRASANHTLSGVAKQIAVKDAVVRVDVAAFLVDEISLDKLFAGRIPVPGQNPEVTELPWDVKDSMFRDEIATVLKYNVRGLEPRYDSGAKAYLFKPYAAVKRKELAFILEDILIKLTGDKELATRYFGQANSPYPDVAVSDAEFNAVMNAVTRGLMEPDLSGAFRPDDDVDGAELLLAVFRLRNVVNIH